MKKTPEQTEAQAQQPDRSIPQGSCRTCDCLRDLLRQLEIDAGEDDAMTTGLQDPFKPDAKLPGLESF